MRDTETDASLQGVVDEEDITRELTVAGLGQPMIRRKDQRPIERESADGGRSEIGEIQDDRDSIEGSEPQPGRAETFLKRTTAIFREEQHLSGIGGGARKERQMMEEKG